MCYYSRSEISILLHAYASEVMEGRKQATGRRCTFFILPDLEIKSKCIKKQGGHRKRKGDGGGEGDYRHPRIYSDPHFINHVPNTKKSTISV